VHSVSKTDVYDVNVFRSREAVSSGRCSVFGMPYFSARGFLAGTFHGVDDADEFGVFGFLRAGRFDWAEAAQTDSAKLTVFWFDRRGGMNVAASTAAVR